MTEFEAVNHCRAGMRRRYERRLTRRVAAIVILGMSAIAWASIFGGMAFVLSAVPH